MPKFNVALLGPSPNMNSMSRRHGAIAGLPTMKYSETSYAMSPQEERALRDSFKNVPGIDPITAQRLGDEAVAKSPHYRAVDGAPRYGGSTPSSSFIQAVNVSPALGLASITMKNGRTYSYPISAKEAGELINADSLGKWYNANIKLHRGGAGTSTIPKSTDATTTAQVLTGIMTSGNNAGTMPVGLGGVGLGGAALGGAAIPLIAQLLKAIKQSET